MARRWGGGRQPDLQEVREWENWKYAEHGRLDEQDSPQDGDKWRNWHVSDPELDSIDEWDANDGLHCAVTQTLERKSRTRAHPGAIAMLFGLKLSRWRVTRAPVHVRAWEGAGKSR